MLRSKIVTLLKEGLDPAIEGKRNFDNPNDGVEMLAAERAEICKGCRYFKKEPIDFFRVKDDSIPDLSEMSCGKCGCILSYKLRQSISICKRWKER